MRKYRSLSGIFSALVVLLPSYAYAAEQLPAPSFGTLLLKMVLVLGGVCLLAWASLRWGLQRFLRVSGEGSAMEVVARLMLEPRRSLIVVRVGDRQLLLGCSESGLELLTELDSEEFETQGATGSATPSLRGFGAVLAAHRRPDVSRETSREAS